MAKYDVRFSCGHEGTVELFGKGKDRDIKIRWYESSGICPDCYKAKKRAEIESMPLTLEHTFNALRVDEASGEPLVILSFSGNAFPAKDRIKALGYFWCDSESTDLRSSITRPVKAWQKEIKVSELDEEVEKAKSIGAMVNFVGLSHEMENFNYRSALELQKKWREKEALKAAIKKPVIPEILNGHRWNDKVYGKKGKYRVYLDGVETFISDDQAADLEKYVTEKVTYRNEIAKVQASVK